MKNKSSNVLLAAGIISLLAIGIPNLAHANAYNRQKKLDQAAHRELRKDNAELQRDRRDLSRLYRSGASRDEIYRKKAEIRGDLQEITQDRRQLGGLYDRYRDGYGNNGRYDNRGWWDRNNNGWWNWGNSRGYERDRWR